MCAAEGKTVKETADLLSREPSTIKSIREDILRKLNCQNITHAVSEGVQYGFLSPKEISNN